MDDAIERIRTAMAARGVNMKRLAERVGVPYGTFQAYLVGRRTMPVALLRSIARELNVNAHWLLTGKLALDKQAIDATLRQMDIIRHYGGLIRDPAATFIELHDGDYARALVGRHDHRGRTPPPEDS